MKLIAMRHGQTAYNQEDRFTGTVDLPLTPEGRMQAQAAGCAPNVPLVFASPLTRAQETARICFPHAELRVVEGLREMCFGRFQGYNEQDLADDAEFQAWKASGWSLTPPEGESCGEHQRMVIDAVEDIVACQERAGAQYAVLATHGGVLMAICDGMLDPAEKGGRTYMDWIPGNCGIICADVCRAPNGSLMLQHLERPETLDLLPCLH